MIFARLYEWWSNLSSGDALLVAIVAAITVFVLGFAWVAFVQPIWKSR